MALLFYLFTHQIDAGIFLYNFFRNQNATLTKIIKAGTSTNGPITPAKACPELIPKTPIETAIASSKLLPAAVNESATLSA